MKMGVYIYFLFKMADALFLRVNDAIFGFEMVFEIKIIKIANISCLNSQKFVINAAKSDL